MICSRITLAAVWLIGMCVTAIAFADPNGPPVEIADPRVAPPNVNENLNSGTKAAVSKSGVFVAFYCYAGNVVAGDTNGLPDIFVLNRLTGGVQRASVHTDGSQANGPSLFPRLSGDGQRVIFASTATNLIDGDTNGVSDVFLRALATGITERISVSTTGVQGNGASSEPAISANGRYVVFTSSATNLVSDDTNSYYDIFVRDLVLETTTRVSTSFSGGPANGHSQNASISDNGRFISYESDATNIALGDFNSRRDVFVKDMLLGTTTRESLSTQGFEGGDNSVFSSISGDGRIVAFISLATNLVLNDTNNQPDCFVRDRLLGTTTRVSVSTTGTQANGITQACEISSDGRVVVFRSSANNLVTGDTNQRYDVFTRNLVDNVTTRVSVNASDIQGNSDSWEGSLNATGDSVVFVSQASNLNSQANQVGVFRVFARGATLPTGGDVNSDGRIDADDVQGFVGAMAMGSAIPFNLLPLVDLNTDGVVNDADVSLFVTTLLNN